MTTETDETAPIPEVLPTGPEPLRVLIPSEPGDESCKANAQTAVALLSRVIRLTSNGMFEANIADPSQLSNHPYLALMNSFSRYAQIVCRNNLGLKCYGAHGIIRIEDSDSVVAARLKPTYVMPLFVSPEAVHGIFITQRRPGSLQFEYGFVPFGDGDYVVTGIF